MLVVLFRPPWASSVPPPRLPLLFVALAPLLGALAVTGPFARGCSPRCACPVRCPPGRPAARRTAPPAAARGFSPCPWASGRLAEGGFFGADILLFVLLLRGEHFCGGRNFCVGATFVIFLCRSVLGVRALPPSAARPPPGRECCLRRAPRAPLRPRPRRPRWHGRHRGARSLGSADRPRLRVGFALGT